MSRLGEGRGGEGRGRKGGVDKSAFTVSGYIHVASYPASPHSFFHNHGCKKSCEGMRLVATYVCVFLYHARLSTELLH